MTALIAIVLGGVGTYLMRASFLGFLGAGLLPPAAERALKYVGPAVFAAIVLPRVLGADGLSGLGHWPSAKVLAALVTGAVAWRTRHVPVTLAVGMISLWLLQWAGLG